MVQAARSGVQNIAEGSQASGTSKKMELKLTNVARASLEELRLDYQDFLRQRGLEEWPANHPALARFKERRCGTLEDVRAWVQEERRSFTDSHGPTRTNTDTPGGNQSAGIDSVSGQEPQNAVGRGDRDIASGSGSAAPPAEATRVPSVPVRDRPCSSVPVPSSSVYGANRALSLLNLCCWLLDRQVAAQARAFEDEGGFTERLHRKRTQRRRER
jgi:four helix bundle suffix protein